MIIQQGDRKPCNARRQATAARGGWRAPPPAAATAAAAAGVLGAGRLCSCDAATACDDSVLQLLAAPSIWVTDDQAGAAIANTWPAPPLLAAVAAGRLGGRR